MIRVTCPEPIVQRMTPLIERFHARHPGLRVEFVMSDRYLDLAKGEADVAFRSGDTDDDLVGRKIADSIWAVYASHDYIERHGKPERVEDLSRHLLVCLDESMGGHRVAKWLMDVAPDATIAARNNSVLGLMYGREIRRRDRPAADGDRPMANRALCARSVLSRISPGVGAC